jgi:hypothetical protein
MKKNILRAIAISTFAIIVFFNISLNGKLKTVDINLGQEAQAYLVCAEYYFGGWICCYSVEGDCLTGNHGNMSFQ